MDKVAGFGTPSIFRTMILVLVAMATLAIVDGVLAGVETKEGEAAASRFYQDGETQMQAGRFRQAADLFRSAVAGSRENRRYRLALGEALLQAGDADEAAATVSDLLALDPMSGTANLAMARLLVRTNRIPEAIFYFHRAIYGQWATDRAAEQLATRLELSDLLSRFGSSEDLLAELLPLQVLIPPRDTTDLRKLASWYLVAKSPARAKAVYRDLLHEKFPDEGQDNIR